MTAQPSPAQVTALLDRARAGRLTPAEQALMAGLLEQARAALRWVRDQALLADVLAVACTYCRARPGEPCRPVASTVPPRTPHTARITAARTARQEARHAR